jgi:hypothetical protein
LKRLASIMRDHPRDKSASHPAHIFLLLAFESVRFY